MIYNEMLCDRCGKPAMMETGYGGNCIICGDDLCIECAKIWHDEHEYFPSCCHSCYEKLVLQACDKALIFDEIEELIMKYGNFFVE